MQSTEGINIIEVPTTGKKRIGFLCLQGLETFIKPIAAHFTGNYEVRECYSNSMPEIQSIIDFSDLVFLEWMNELTVQTTQKIPQLKDKKVIVRCHSYEALQNFSNSVNWLVVDHLIFVADHVRDLVLKQYPKLNEIVDISVIPNGVPI